MHGDAADEMVRMVLNGTEVAIKLTGSAAKNLAALLVAWSKNEKKVYGKTTMMKLLKSGEPLQVLSMTKEQYSKFKSIAKKKVLYAPFLNKKRGDGKLDVVISEKSLPMVNHMLSYADVREEDSGHMHFDAGFMLIKERKCVRVIESIRSVYMMQYWQIYKAEQYWQRKNKKNWQVSLKS